MTDWELVMLNLKPVPPKKGRADTAKCGYCGANMSIVGRPTRKYCSDYCRNRAGK